jgi:putative FmdB family regulatory protein
MSKYVYYCKECDSTFESEVEHPEDGVPLQTVCPACGDKNAMKAFAAETAESPGGCCEPGSGCCG